MAFSGRGGREWGGGESRGGGATWRKTHAATVCRDPLGSSGVGAQKSRRKAGAALSFYQMKKFDAAAGVDKKNVVINLTKR